MRRKSNGLSRTIVFWENVEGVLKDKTNAFGCFLASLAGENEPFKIKRWGNAGLIRGPIRNIAWRVLDAKFFGLPQQRKRLYVVATDKDKNPEEILFEKFEKHDVSESDNSLIFEKDAHRFEVFREYTDCLYSAYGTKWNGNAAAMNGSLFVVQDGRIRRLSPLECERLMGLPDNYTNIPGAKKTNRYQATGNSWAVPVISWIGQRIAKKTKDSYVFNKIDRHILSIHVNSSEVFCLGDYIETYGGTINCSPKPNLCIMSSMKEIIDCNPPEDIYISPVGCYGIIRRKNERKLKINPRLEQVLQDNSRKMTQEEIEAKSRVQKRGRFSTQNIVFVPQMTLFNT